MKSTKSILLLAILTGTLFLPQILFAQDTDGDDMPDAWETSNPCLLVNVADGHIDHDADGMSSIDEYKSATDPCKPDSDNDGMRDGWENKTGLNPLVDDAGLDPDADGLTNYSESLIGSLPNNSDTDESGINDGDEQVLGFNPLNNKDDISSSNSSPARRP